MRGDSTGQLKAARKALLDLLGISDQVINLLLSADQVEVPIFRKTAEQLLKVLKDICEHLTTLQPEILRFIGEVICLDSTGSITLMYKFHDAYFLSKEYYLKGVAQYINFYGGHATQYQVYTRS